MRVLVTGGAGFIGSHLVESLLLAGHSVTVVDNLSTGSEENLKHVINHPELWFCEGSVQDYGSMDRVMRRETDAVVHLAAVASVPVCESSPMNSFSVNVEGTQYLLDRAQAYGVRRFLFASSAAVYGPTLLPVPYREGAATKPVSVYGTHKLIGEQLVRQYHKAMTTLSLRFFNVYGPRQKPCGSVIPTWIDRAFRGKPLIAHGGLTQTRDFVYVGDVVRAILKALRVDDTVSGESLNIAFGESVSLHSLLHEMIASAGIKREQYNVEHRPGRPGDVLFSPACIENAKVVLGYRPSVNLRLGLRVTGEWMLEGKETLPFVE